MVVVNPRTRPDPRSNRAVEGWAFECFGKLTLDSTCGAVDACCADGGTEEQPPRLTDFPTKEAMSGLHPPSSSSPSPPRCLVTTWSFAISCRPLHWALQLLLCSFFFGQRLRSGCCGAKSRRMQRYLQCAATLLGTASPINGWWVVPR